MKFPKLLMFLSLWPLLLAQTCVKDAEENNNDDAVEVKFAPNEEVTKTMAIEDWEQFLKQSQQDIDDAEANIGTLQIRIDDADDAQKQEWQEVCDWSNLTLIKMKASRSKRNKMFENSLDHYNRAVYEQNEAYETQFNHDMDAIEKKLEHLLEKIRSGYYK